MAYEHYFRDDMGREAIPANEEDWAGWVRASGARNFCQDNTLTDWLDLYGEANGFLPDNLLPGYDGRTDFVPFIFAKGHAFEAAVLAHLATLAQVVTIDESDRRSLACVDATWEAMRTGAEVIAQGLLRNPQNQTFGAADLLVRSDVLARLFPDAIAAGEEAIGAPAFEHEFHYRVVDVKFSTLHLDKTGHAASVHLPYMAQVAIYNAALGRIQGYEPPSAYLLGRGWEQGVEDGQPRCGSSCRERLARVDMAWSSRTKVLSQTVAGAVEWLRRLRRDGAAWQVLPEPSVLELWPNPKEADGWNGTTKRIAAELADVTLAWHGTVEARRQAHAHGIRRWTDPRCTAEALGISGECNSTVADRVLATNRDAMGPAIVPGRITAAVEEWAKPGALEFFVDFETVSNLDDDFSSIPERGGQALIFMVGCGHLEDGGWRFTSFAADSLDLAAERRMLDAWFAHMETTRQRLAPGLREPLVFHWSPAERSGLSTAVESARARHAPASSRWREPLWFDFLNRVVKAKGDPVVVRGAMGFGLKEVANALHDHGLIETRWGQSISDGLGAMVAAWRAEPEARAAGIGLGETALMQEVAAYNEVDCRVMMEVIACLRGRAA